MAFCKNCGAQNNENDAFCTNCGAQLTEEVVETPVVEAPAKKKNGMGIASLICSIASWIPCNCFGGITAILAIIFAIVSMKKVGKNGLATAGLIIGIITLVLGIISGIVSGVMVLLNPAFLESLTYGMY